MGEKPQVQAGDELPGDRAHDCREHIGGVFLLARGTRPDVLTAVGVLGRFVAKWTKAQDRALHRLFAYLWGAKDRGLLSRIHKADYSTLHMMVYWDADHAESKVTTRSTSGWAMFVAGPNTRFLLDYGSKLQHNASYSTPAAETVAGAIGLTRSAWPL